MIVYVWYNYAFKNFTSFSMLFVRLDSKPFKNKKFLTINS